MKTDDSENVALKSLLQCSQRNETSSNSIIVCSWDEMSSWKCVAPMCSYVKAKRKKDSSKNKKKSPYLKQRDVDTLPPEYDNYSIECSKNLAYSSTDVLSYDSPTSRDIVDTKTFDYLDREQYRHLSDYLLRQRSRNLLDSYTHRIDDVYINEGKQIERQIVSSHSERIKENIRQGGDKRALSYMDQVKLANIKLSLRKTCGTLMDGSKSSKSDSKLNLQHQQTTRKEEKVRSEKQRSDGKCKEPQYDNDLIKIQTLYLPPVERRSRRRNMRNLFEDDESEDDACFPFRISRVSDGRSVAQNINVDNMATYIIDQKCLRSSSKTKEEKGLVKDELPPLAGLYMS